MKKIRNIILILLILGVLSLILWLSFSIRAYQAFSKEELFATITCQKSRDASFDYFIFYKPENQKEPSIFGIKGNQWRIEGVIIKWKGFVNILGIHTRHKPVRLAGRYSDIKMDKIFGLTEYVLNGGEDNFWRVTYRLSKYLPFIEAAYGNAAFMPCKEKVVYKIYVTTSGYMVKTERK